MFGTAEVVGRRVCRQETLIRCPDWTGEKLGHARTPEGERRVHASRRSATPLILSSSYLLRPIPPLGNCQGVPGPG